MSKRKVYYKVCRINSDGNPQSACDNSRFPEEFRVTYKLGEYVGPNIENTRLFLFDTFEAAQVFRDTMGNRHKIYRCEATKIGVPKHIPRIHPPYIKRFWMLKKAHRIIKFVIGCQAVPIGSRTAATIKLLSVVDV